MNNLNRVNPRHAKRGGGAILALVILAWLFFPKHGGEQSTPSTPPVAKSSSDVRVDYEPGGDAGPPTIKVTFLGELSRAEMSDSLRAALEKWKEMTPAPRGEAIAAAFNAEGDSLHLFYRYDPATDQIAQFFLSEAPDAAMRDAGSPLGNGRQVKGYYRKDGTYVHGYSRRK